MQEIHLLDIWIWKGAKQNWNAHMANFPSSLQRLFNLLLYLEWKQLVKPNPLVQLLWRPSYILNMHLQILFQGKENPKGQGNIFRELWKDRCATLKLRCWASHESCTIFLLFCIWHSHCSIRMVKAKDLHRKTKKQQSWSLILRSMALISSAMQHVPKFHLQGASLGCSTLFYVAISLFQCAVQGTAFACKLLLQSYGGQLLSGHCGIPRTVTHLSVFPLSSDLTTLCKMVSESKQPWICQYCPLFSSQSFHTAQVQQPFIFSW